MSLITIIDTGICNIASVANAFSRIGCAVTTTNSKDAVENAEVLVLPGVGAYEQGMNALKRYDLITVLNKRVLSDKIPIIGICLGMQMLATKSSEYGEHEGLGFIPGNVISLETENPEYRIPNMGWCDVLPDKESIIFPGGINKEIYYHVHSYHIVCDDLKDKAAHIEFSDKDITVAIERENIFGMQFHPEKSQDDGLNLLTRIIKHLLK